jgi:hypothetical protein
MLYSLHIPGTKIGDKYDVYLNAQHRMINEVPLYALLHLILAKLDTPKGELPLETLCTCDRDLELGRQHIRRVRIALGHFRVIDNDKKGNYWLKVAPDSFTLDDWVWQIPDPVFSRGFIAKLRRAYKKLKPCSHCVELSNYCFQYVIHASWHSKFLESTVVLNSAYKTFPLIKNMNIHRSPIITSSEDLNSFTAFT